MSVIVFFLKQSWNALLYKKGYKNNLHLISWWLVEIHAVDGLYKIIEMLGNSKLCNSYYVVDLTSVLTHNKIIMKK